MRTARPPSVRHAATPRMVVRRARCASECEVSKESRIHGLRQVVMRGLVTTSRTAVRGFVSVTSRLPKDDRLVLFGAMNGAWYGDNSRHLYEWLLAHRLDVRAVWMTRDEGVHRRLRAEGKPVALS